MIEVRDADAKLAPEVAAAVARPRAAARMAVFASTWHCHYAVTIPHSSAG